ncbi:MAG: hypothetical protein IKT57_07990 [Clostridia bacterium]|nr:hypothetical protein [Clostridia bacterium]
MELFEALIPLLFVGLAVYSKAKKKQDKQNKETKRVNSWEGAYAPSEELLTVQNVLQTPYAQVPVQQSFLQPVQEKKAEPFPAAVQTMASSITFPEGVDPCHDGMYEEESEMPVVLGVNQEEKSPLAQDMVLGIIWGEIMSAPKCRNHSRK